MPLQDLTQTKRRWVKVAKLPRQRVRLSAVTPRAQAVIFSPLDADAAAATTRGA